MPRSRRNSARAICCLTVALAGSPAARADQDSDPERAPEQQLAGDYFVGASVFLFERTVLAAFVPAEAEAPPDPDQALDAGAIVLARENADHEAGSVALQAILGWLKAWIALEKNNPDSAAPPGFDPKRRHALACLAYGSDPVISAELADHAGLSTAERGTCIQRYTEARNQWTGWLQPYRKNGDASPPVRATPEGAPAEEQPGLRLAFAPTLDEANQAIADAMRENGLFQVLTDDLNATLAMPRPVIALITQCGEASTFYNPERGEAVVCYEMLRALIAAAP